MKWEVDGGFGDRHTIEVADGLWHGWENLCTDVPRGPQRTAAIREVLTACVRGHATSGTYSIRRLPDTDSDAG